MATYTKTDHIYFTKEEESTLQILLKNQGKITSRDDIAKSVWGERWLQKYSDWQIDRLIYLVRKKLASAYQINTLRNSGYIFLKKGIAIPNIISKKTEGALPTESYLEYMNEPKNKRKVLKDLFKAIRNEKLDKQIPKFIAKVLIINSYSYDNVDAVSRWLSGRNIKPEIYFTNFDERALKLHRDRVRKLKLTNFHCNFDDIRDSVFKDNCFDLIINDFRLNFNETDIQNKNAMKNMNRILKPNGIILLAVVIDNRFESKRFGNDQEKAPINKDKPWTFEAQEGLRRNCFTIPYYKRLFKSGGYNIVKEFDITGGKKWKPAYRRFILKKN